MPINNQYVHRVIQRKTQKYGKNGSSTLVGECTRVVLHGAFVLKLTHIGNFRVQGFVQDDDKGNRMLIDPISRITLIGCEKMAYNIHDDSCGRNNDPITVYYLENNIMYVKYSKPSNYNSIKWFVIKMSQTFGRMVGRGSTSPQILMPFSLSSNFEFTKLNKFLHSLLALVESGEYWM